MQADLPHTLYLKDETKRSKGNNGRQASHASKKTIASDEVIRLQEEANRRLMERKVKEAQAEPEVTIDDLFKK